MLFPRDVAKPVIHKPNDPRSRLKVLLEDGAYRRLGASTEFITCSHRELIQGQHCYLMFLGVNRVEQGKSTGSRLLKLDLETADEKQRPCLLDTMNAGNTAFYGRHNFAVCSEKRICVGGPSPGPCSGSRDRCRGQL